MTLYHMANPYFTPIEDNNKLSKPDTAGGYYRKKPYRAGGFEWIIPNKFKVKGEAGDGKEFGTVTQAFTMDGNGTLKITKAGAEVKRTRFDK